MENILRYGLMPRRELLDFEDVADPSIINKRERLGLDNFVPFHFFPRNPFDYGVRHNHQFDQFVYICLYRSKAQKMGFRIINKHPLALEINDYELYDYDSGFDVIDWDKMDERNHADHDCKMVSMAECLHEGVLDAQNFDIVYTENEHDEVEMKELVEELDLDIKVFSSPNKFP